jgi:uncharacterized membrane protein YphA (DoxX/SURF4 family)
VNKWRDYAFAGLRIYLGIIFAIAVYAKFEKGPAFISVLNGYLANFGLQHANPFYQRLLSTAIIPHVSTIATLVVVAECAVALALITGTLTRLAAVIAMFLLTNYMMSKGLWWWSPSSNDSGFFMIALALAISAAGRVFGVDALLAKRWPQSILW